MVTMVTVCETYANDFNIQQCFFFNLREELLPNKAFYSRFLKCILI